MKPSVKIVVCTIILITLSALSCGSPQRDETPVINDDMGAENKLIGVWKVAEIAKTDLDIPETEMGVPDAYMVLTEKYKFVVGSAMPNRQKLPENPTDSQLVAAWSPFWAFVSTYEVKENAIATRELFAKNPKAEVGEQDIIPYKFDGEDLLWTVKVNDGKNTATLKYTRVE